MPQLPNLSSYPGRAHKRQLLAEIPLTQLHFPPSWEDKESRQELLVNQAWIQLSMMGRGCL
jgi:hypothetical protein